ncbi:CHC2 zinc finger domain-containing protein [Nonomuraea sp. NPDC050536]|uniref:CHC2 zinc finger domain-containing protein n=1 Tax=Nonomuraea sp. NPDC050536 TaxID=3364366 RepID=UPI0037C53BC8
MSATANISDWDIARIRQLNPIAHVAQDLGYELEMRGDGEFVIPCIESLDPETRVAFSRSLIPERGMYYCQHCSSGGDVISLVEKDKKISFREAVEYLAKRAGIRLAMGAGE